MQIAYFVTKASIRFICFPLSVTFYLFIKFPTYKLEEPNIVLKTYDDTKLPVSGMMDVCVEHCGIVYPGLTVYVLDHHDVNMLGRDWLNAIKINWRDLFGEGCAKKGIRHQNC